MKVGDLVRYWDVTDNLSDPPRIGLIYKIVEYSDYGGATETQYWAQWENGSCAWAEKKYLEVISEGR